MFYAHLINGILTNFVDGTKFISTSSQKASVSLSLLPMWTIWLFDITITG